jgi:hypothetical protein
MDSLPAGEAGEAWLNGIIDRLGLRAPMLDHERRLRPAAEITNSTAEDNTSITTLWVDHKPVAQYIRVRDGLNFTFLTCVDMTGL